MKIGGKERVLAFTINALLELKEIHQVDLLKGEGQEGMTLEKIRAIAFVGLKHGAKKEGSQFTGTIEEVGDWMELSTVAELMKFIQDQTIGDKPPGEKSAGESHGLS